MKPTVPQPVSVALLNSDDNCVRRASRVHHGEADKARPRRIDQPLPSAIEVTRGHSIDQHRHRQHPSRYLDWDCRIPLRWVGRAGVDPRAVQRKLNLERAIPARLDEVTGLPKSAQR